MPCSKLQFHRYETKRNIIVQPLKWDNNTSSLKKIDISVNRKILVQFFSIQKPIEHLIIESLYYNICYVSDMNEYNSWIDKIPDDRL